MANRQHGYAPYALWANVMEYEDAHKTASDIRA